MSFVVEDGTGVKGANSYATVQFFRDHHTDRGVSGVDVGTLPDVTVQALLVKAADYVDARWGSRFLGTRKFTALSARSVFTLASLPTDGETVTVGSVTYTFRNAVSTSNEIAIAETTLETLTNAASALTNGTNEKVSGAEIADPDVPALTVFTTSDGVATTETTAGGSFDAAASAGYSPLRQNLEFPRANLTDRDGNSVSGVPKKLRQAVSEYALRANTAALAPDPAADASGLILSGSRTKVGPIETQVNYAQSGLVLFRPYPIADALLSEYVAPAGVRRA